MTHDLKLWPKYFDAVLAGHKTFEWRLNDRDFKVGDHVLLREWDPQHVEEDGRGGPRGYTGREVRFAIGYMLPVENNFVVFSLVKPKRLSLTNGTKQ